MWRMRHLSPARGARLAVGLVAVALAAGLLTPDAARAHQGDDSFRAAKRAFAFAFTSADAITADRLDAIRSLARFDGESDDCEDALKLLFQVAGSDTVGHDRLLASEFGLLEERAEETEDRQQVTEALQSPRLTREQQQS